MGVSALILTLNEDINIEACLEALAWSDDVVVLDSFSKDQTTSIAAQRGVRVVQRTFDNWAAHQNWALQNIEFKNPWVLYFDADERCTPALRDEVLRRAIPAAPESAFRIRRKDFFMGRWLKHAQLYPTWLIRLFRPSKIRYERLVNPVAQVDGAIGELAEHIIHYPFSHGISHWIARHNNYSDLEAQELMKVHLSPQPRQGGLLDRDPNIRRRALKNLFYRLPARPVVKFAYYLLWRRGFLDGRAGWTYSSLQAIYEYFIDCKYRELLRRQRGQPV